MVISRWIKPDTKLYVRLNDISRSLDWFFEFRPILFFTIWTMMAAGLSAYKGDTIDEFYWSTTVHWPLFWTFLGTTLVASSSALKGEDSGTNKLTLVLLVAGFLIVLSSVAMNAVETGKMSRLFAVGAWVSIFYVSWRLYLKHWKKLKNEKMIMRISLSVLPALSLFMIGWHLGGGKILSGMLASAPYACGFIAVTLLWPISVKAEKLHHRDFMNEITRIVGLGGLLLTVSIFLGYRMGDPVISTASIITIPFFAVALVVSRAEHIIRAFKYPIMILAFFVSVRYPWLCVAMFLNFNVIRLYNYFRHGVIRPTLKVSYD
jgi:hypothetical protein